MNHGSPGSPPHVINNTIDWDKLQPLNAENARFQTDHLTWNEVLHDPESSPQPNIHTEADRLRSPTDSTLKQEDMKVEASSQAKVARKRPKRKATEASLLSGKKYYNKIKSDPEKWRTYKEKKREWYKGYVAKQPEQKKQEIRARKERERKARLKVRQADPTKRARPNSRMKLRAKIKDNTATEAEIEKYKYLLEKDRLYHQEVKMKQMQSAVTFVSARPMDRDSRPNDRSANGRSALQQPEIRTSDHEFLHSGIGPRLLGFESLDKATTPKQENHSQLTPIQIKNKKYYRKIREDPTSWEAYKAKKRTLREKRMKDLPAEQLDRIRMQTLKRVQKWRLTQKSQRKGSRSNARTRFRDNLKSGTATVADLESYFSLFKIINAVQLGIDLNEPLAQGGDLWPMGNDSGQGSPPEGVLLKETTDATSQATGHLKVRAKIHKAMKRKHSQTYLKNLRADPKRYEIYLAKKNSYEQQRRKDMTPEEKKNFVSRNKIYQHRYYTKKKQSDPNFRRQGQRPALRKEIEQGTATEQQIKTYNQLLETDKRYQANKRAKRMMQEQKDETINKEHHTG
ncbi:uncharacterized protein FA14DRAFT_182422 [Meira miltonrushii]|uniref:Uncharacterized protein n=1 Tax=Meira miltonrushii TaxID=1280837 RepID=A0A316V556_9BASI|nr:uncharacterized protein FA14DRAFT_182422 [Meira miltonrushii]PWN31631.1 hypothetical protein FA14DRAFT_182422 [Meira miltonrushii]